MSKTADMAPLVGMASSVVNATCLEYRLNPTARERASMVFEFLAEWLARHNAGSRPMQEIKIHWPTGGGT